jgi:radical SAM superfamily enzyme
MAMQKKPYRDLNTYFRTRFGCRVHKVTVDAGLNCPNRDGTLSTGGCIYCNAKGSGTGAHGQGVSITRQIERSKDRIARRFKTNLLMAYFQSFTNTYAPVDHLQAIYDEALAVENVVGLAIGTRPDCVDEAVLDLLETYTKSHLIWIEYGLQSAHDRTLSLINRGHDLACFERAVAATRNRNINICAHVILGLPGESRQDMMEPPTLSRPWASTGSNCTCSMWCGEPPWKPCTVRAATDAWSSGNMLNGSAASSSGSRKQLSSNASPETLTPKSWLLRPGPFKKKIRWT